jgi:hypothetical protein
LNLSASLLHGRLHNANLGQGVDRHTPKDSRVRRDRTIRDLLTEQPHSQFNQNCPLGLWVLSDEIPRDGGSYDLNGLRTPKVILNDGPDKRGHHKLNEVWQQVSKDLERVHFFFLS